MTVQSRKMVVAEITIHVDGCMPGSFEHHPGVTVSFWRTDKLNNWEADRYHNPTHASMERLSTIMMKESEEHRNDERRSA